MADNDSVTDPPAAVETAGRWPQGDEALASSEGHDAIQASHSNTRAYRDEVVVAEAYAATATAHDISLVGKQVDRYEVVRELGAGAMGAVYEVRHLRLGKPFAMKVIHAELARVPEFLARFDREAMACSTLDHPACISVTDYGRTASGQPFLVMEYVKGQPLNEVLYHNGAFFVVTALSLIRDVLRGLDHAHKRGVIHRDIKLENVMMVCHEGEQSVKILDFGIAKAPLEGAPQLTQAGVVFGTPEYMAPEQTVSAQVDARADLYAVGVMVFAMLTGRTPFAGLGQIELMQKKLIQPAPALSALAPAGATFDKKLERFVARALEREPDRRFQSAEQMLAEIDTLMAALGFTAPSTVTGLAPAGASDPSLPRSTTPLATLASWGGSAKRAAVGATSWWSQQLRSYLQGVKGGSFRDKASDLVHTTAGRIVLATGATVLLLSAVLTCSLIGSDDEFAPTTRRYGLPLSNAGQSPHDTNGSVPARGVKLMPAPVTNDPALVSARLMIAKKACREATIDLKNLLAREPQKAAAHYLLGAARMCRYRYRQALDSYRKAIAIEPRYRGDARIHDDVTRIAQRRRALRSEVVSFIDKTLGTAGIGLLLQLASGNRSLYLRRAARDLAVAKGLGSRVDWVASLSLDLAQLPSCRRRLAVVQRLRHLGDPRALPALRKARRARSGFLGFRHKNRCARKEIRATIEELEKKK